MLETLQLPLARGHKVIRESVHANDDTLLVRAPNGQTLVTIRVLEDRPGVELTCPELHISCEQRIRLTADDIEIDARRDLSVRAGRDVALAAAGTHTTVADTIRSHAVAGDLALSARDDMKLNAARIGLNSPDLPRRANDGATSTSTLVQTSDAAPSPMELGDELQ